MTCAAVVLGGCGERQERSSEQPQVYVVDLAGGKAERVTRISDTHGEPVWSPDGRRIASVAGRLIEVVSANGEHRRLINVPILYGPIAWSRDGRRISFLSHDPTRAGTGLALVDVSGAGAQTTVRLRETVSGDSAWAPGGEVLAYRHVAVRGVAPTAPPGQDLAAVTLAGRALPRLVKDRAWVGNPVWAPDARKVAFDSTRTQESPMALWLVGARGAKAVLRRVVPFSKDWSPHADRLVVSAGPARGGGRSGLYVVPVDGGAPRRIAGPAGHVAWSPDGRLIAFGAGDRLELIGPDGRGRRTLVRREGQEIVYLAWSPDSRRIAFTAARRQRSSGRPPPRGPV